MKGRHHFAASLEPLKEGSTIKALCGAEVPKARFKAFVDGDGWDAGPNEYAMVGRMHVNCGQCDAITKVAGRLTYVICAGQEARDEEQSI